MLTITRPGENECAPYHRAYVDLIQESNVHSLLEAQIETLRGLQRCVPAAKETFAYAPGKWSVRQVVGHLNDGERVFGYRAFAFSRGDQTPLPGFEEDDYVANATSHTTPLAALVDEFALLRQANLAMFRQLGEEQWTRVGTANNARVSVRALAFIMAGHLRHHLGTLRDRYGINVTD